MTPYYQDDLVTLYHGDALDVMPELRGSSFGLVVTDPPYIIGATSVGNRLRFATPSEHHPWPTERTPALDEAYLRVVRYLREHGGPDLERRSEAA